jgi:PAS domain S-box-containing protein
MTQILVADDIDANRYLLLTLLKGHGYEVAVAGNGAEALELAHASPPDLLITDILMPIVDGFELCRRWKRDDRLKRTPVIIYTATYTDPRDEHLALSLGADRFLIKPQLPETLVQIVREVLRDVARGRPVAAPITDDNVRLLEMHNEELVRKLGKKVADLETEIIERSRVEATLRDSTNLMRIAGRMARLGGWSIDLATRTVQWSEQVAEMLGAAPDRDPSVEVAFARVEPESRRRAVAAFEACVRDGTPGDLEMEVVTPAGKRLWIRAVAEAVRDDSGAIRKVQGAVQDITERRTADHALRASEEHLRVLNAELERRVSERTADLESFSYSVSHDLRAPLRSVNAYASELLSEHGQLLPESGQQMVHTIHRAGQRMGHLIDDLLRLSQLGRQALRCTTVDTSSLVRGVFDELMRGHDHAINLQIGELPLCHADASLLRQVWMNLASNALKYSRDRSPAIIEVGHTPDNAYYIRDNGVGFDMRYAKKLFGVFQRLHASSRFEGEGIGLAIVERIVRRHGGRVWADGELDRGSTFWFTLEDSRAARSA